MKNLKNYNAIRTLLLITIYCLNVQCTRDIADDALLSKNVNTAEIFTDSPIGMGTNFYFPYGKDANNPIGSNVYAWSVDQTVSYKGTSSMRFDVPFASDPNGNYAGGILRIDGAGRDLSGFDAITFWAKASQGVTVGQIGFGEDFYPDKYITTLLNINIGTNWTKIIIPIPDASKLINEKGMLRYAAGTQNTNGFGYTFWIDELKFEKLGTIGQPRPKIMNGINVVQQSYVSSEITLTGLTQTHNMPSGQDQTVTASPSFFKFVSSNNAVAKVNELGVVTLIGIGTATITASLNNVQAIGSLLINAGAAFVNAPNPVLPQTNVISIFSDFYSSVTNFNPGFFAGNNTGIISIPVFGNNKHLNYQSIDFVGLAWNSSVNVSNKTMLHLDIQLKSNVGANLKVELIDFGLDNIDNGIGANNGTAGGFNVSSQLVKDNWVSINIPLNAFTLPTGGGGTGSPNKSNIGYVVFVSNNNAAFLVDNIYFY